MRTRPVLNSAREATHRLADGNRVEEQTRLVLHRDNDLHELVELSVYADGLASIGGGLSWPFDGFAEAVEGRDVVAHVEDGVRRCDLRIVDGT